MRHPDLSPPAAPSPVDLPADTGLAARRALPVSRELLERHDVNGPRYTSYPTADRFVEAFGAGDYRTALAARAQGLAGAVGAAPLSVYVHVPFCEQVCYYCACNKVITRQHGRALPYLDALEGEIALHRRALDGRASAGQLHLGGGTPTFLSDDELGRLMEALAGAFDFTPGAERAIEVDPRTVDARRLAHLKSLGFNRLSFGVQDFEPAVQRAVHRIQPASQVESLLASARALGFSSTNVDLIYGLPMQTPETFARTLDRISALRPERIALYGYAHLPQRFKPQRRIADHALPGAAAKVMMLAQAIARFGEAGYVYIGMDHFALPDDPLAIAKARGALIRNFQGYSTLPMTSSAGAPAAHVEGDLIGLGVSSIGRIGAVYAQNAKTLDEYQDAIARGEFATVRGLAATRDDLLRRAVIMALMCQGRVDFEAVGAAHLVDFRAVFANELAELAPLQASGLVEVSDDAIEVTALGWYFVRAIAMVFDRHWQADRARDRYSRVL